MSTKHILLALLVPIIWGIGFVIAKPAMDFIPPILLNGLRWSITGFIMIWFVPFPKSFFKEIFLIAFIGSAVQYSFTYSGLNLIEASTATLLVQSEVPFAIILAYFILGEKPIIKNIVGLVIAFIGIVILSGNPNLNGKYIGVFFVLLGTLTWAFGQILAKPVANKIGGLTLTAWLGAFAGPQCIFASILIEGDTLKHILNSNMNTWFIIIYLSLGMNIIGYSIWYYILSKHPINKVMPVLLLFPVTGLLTAFFYLGEKLNIYSIIGGLIIITGVSVILIDKKR